MRVSHEEALLLRAAQSLATRPLQFTSVAHDAGVPTFWELAAAPCPFLDGDGSTCRVYQIRPFKCRQFVCYRASGNASDPQTHLEEMFSDRDYRKDYARRQHDAQRWAVRHGWTGRES